MAFKQRGKFGTSGLLVQNKRLVLTLQGCLCAHYKASCTDAASGLQPHNERHYAGKLPIRLVANLNRGQL